MYGLYGMVFPLIPSLIPSLAGEMHVLLGWGLVIDVASIKPSTFSL